METIDRLESSIQKLFEANREIQKERDDLSRRVQAIGNELDQARETIRSLRGDLAKYMDSDDRYREFDAKKSELREHILSIIERIEKYSDSDPIDSITNG
jgi:uncharacterized coiled-coil DUF342 family protein